MVKKMEMGATTDEWCEAIISCDYDNGQFETIDDYNVDNVIKQIMNLYES